MSLDSLRRRKLRMRAGSKAFGLLLCLSLCSVHAIAQERIWIDTDPACGVGRRVDPDDCLALLMLLARRDVNVVGVGTVFGNASEAQSASRAESLMQLIGARAPLYRGAAERMSGQGPVTEASSAIGEAIDGGPLTIVALGPLTNLAVAMERADKNKVRAVKVIAVMGKDPGQVFHPAEGAAGAFLRHGPIFRDLNFSLDPEAAQKVIASGAELILAPHALGRTQKMDKNNLDQLAQLGAAARWVAEGTSGWLAYWSESIGRDGFYPFDLAAAAVAVDRRFEACPREPIVVARDAQIGSFGGPISLMFSGDARLGRVHSVRVCRLLPRAASELLMESLQSR